MAHGDRLSAKDLSLDETDNINDNRGPWRNDFATEFTSFGVNETHVVFATPNGWLVKILKATGALISDEFLLTDAVPSRQEESSAGRFSNYYSQGFVCVDNNRALWNQENSLDNFNFIWGMNTDFTPRKLNSLNVPGGTNKAMGIDGNNLYVVEARDRNAQNHFVRVNDLTSSTKARVNALEFSRDDLGSSVIVPADIRGIIVRNDLITFFNTAGRGFSYSKTTKARMATMDINLGYTPSDTFQNDGRNQFYGQQNGAPEFYAQTSNDGEQFGFRVYEYNPDPAATALGEIARQSGGAATKKTYTHILRGGHTATQKIYRGSAEIWTPGAVPAITSFTAAPSSVDLDTRATGNITLTFAATDSTNNRITNKRTGANVPLTTSTTAVVAQPLEPTTYVLTCRNEHGSTHQEVTVDVTRNPQVNNLRRTGFRQSLHGTDSGTYRFGATIIGLPQPTLRYQFSVGGSGTISARHLTQGARPDTWTLDWTHYFGTNVPRRLTITATNASGSASASVANIQAG